MDANLQTPISDTSFPAMTLNIGPQTVCHPHRDSRNLVTSVCGDMSAGLYDWRRGGHLILHEPRVIIELPPGVAILFPSSCLTHENITVGDGETRYSLTWYMAGTLVQFVDQGYRTQKQWAAVDTAGLETYHAASGSRWEQGLAMFKTLTGLEAFWSDMYRD